MLVILTLLTRPCKVTHSHNGTAVATSSFWHFVERTDVKIAYGTYFNTIILWFNYLALGMHQSIIGSIFLLIKDETLFKSYLYKEYNISRHHYYAPMNLYKFLLPDNFSHTCSYLKLVKRKLQRKPSQKKLLPVSHLIQENQPDLNMDGSYILLLLSNYFNTEDFYYILYTVLTNVFKLYLHFSMSLTQASCPQFWLRVYHSVTIFHFFIRSSH